MLIRLLAVLFNAFPVRWQRRFMTAAHDRFLVGVTGLGIDETGQVLLARHRFGAPQWRFLGGFLHPRERVEVGPVLEVVTGYRWERVEIVFAYRVTGGTAVLTSEIEELRSFAADALPEVRADQRGLIERHATAAIAWSKAQ